MSINSGHRNGDDDDDDNGKDDHPSAPLESPSSKVPKPNPDKTHSEFGVEGTNKTIPVPKPDGAPSEELGGPVKSRHVSKTPYTRG